MVSPWLWCKSLSRMAVATTWSPRTVPPVADGAAGGDQDAAPFVAADELERQRRRRGLERQPGDEAVAGRLPNSSTISSSGLLNCASRCASLPSVRPLASVVTSAVAWRTARSGCAGSPRAPGHLTPSHPRPVVPHRLPGQPTSATILRVPQPMQPQCRRPPSGVLIPCLRPFMTDAGTLARPTNPPLPCCPGRLGSGWRHRRGLPCRLTHGAAPTTRPGTQPMIGTMIAASGWHRATAADAASATRPNQHIGPPSRLPWCEPPDDKARTAASWMAHAPAAIIRCPHMVPHRHAAAPPEADRPRTAIRRRGAGRGEGGGRRGGSAPALAHLEWPRQGYPNQHQSCPLGREAFPGRAGGGKRPTCRYGRCGPPCPRWIAI